MSQSVPKNLTFEEAMTALRNILNKRLANHVANGQTDEAAAVRMKLSTVHSAPGIEALWNILGINPSLGCCSYKVNGMDVCFHMTSDECAMAQGVFTEPPCTCPENPH